MINNCYNFIGTSILLMFSVNVREISTYDCYSCRGINCQRTTRTNDTITCSDQWDNCVTIFSGFTVLERGCFSKIPETYRLKCEESTTDGECLNCFGDRCNNKGVAKCIHCNSKDHKDCLSNPDLLAPTHCPISTSSNTYCFIRSGRKEYLERGCLSDLTNQNECQKDPLCSMCLPTAGVPCNNQFKANVASGSSGANICILLISATLLLAV